MIFNIFIIFEVYYFHSMSETLYVTHSITLRKAAGKLYSVHLIFL